MYSSLRSSFSVSSRAVRRALRRSISESLERRALLTIEASGVSSAVTVDSELVLQSVAGATAGDGSSVIVYSDRDSITGKGKDVFVRRFDAAGVALGAAVIVNTTTSGAQMNPDVAVNANGAYVVSWQSEGQDGDGWGVYAQRFNAGGVAQGGEIRINQTTSGNQTSPKVGIDSAGNFVVAFVYESFNNGDIAIAGFNASGAYQYELAMNVSNAQAYASPAIAMKSDGVFAVAWVRTNLTTDNSTDIQAQVFDAGNQMAGSVITITDAGDQASPSIAASGSQFTLAWADESTSEASIFFRRINTSGAFSGSAIQANQDSIGNRTRPSVAVDANDNVVIGWTQQEAQTNYSSNVYRSFDANNIATSNEIAVTDGSTARTLMDVAFTAQGKLIALSTLGEFIGYGLGSLSGFANVLSFTGTSGNDELVAYDLNATTIRTNFRDVAQDFSRTAFSMIRVALGHGDDTVHAEDCSLMLTVNGGSGNDTILTGSGGDSIAGGDGNDSISTGDGNDYAIGDSGTDVMSGQNGNDTLTGSGSKDTIFGGEGNDRIAGGGSPDVINGEGGDDRLYGDDGDDRLDGGGNVDRLYGGEGVDYLVGGSSNDRLFGENGNDTLIGSKGNDYLDGGLNTDTVLNKESGDTLVNIEIQ